MVSRMSRARTAGEFNEGKFPNVTYAIHLTFWRSRCCTTPMCHCAHMTNISFSMSTIHESHTHTHTHFICIRASEHWAMSMRINQNENNNKIISLSPHWITVAFPKRQIVLYYTTIDYVTDTPINWSLHKLMNMNYRKIERYHISA